MLRDLLLLHHLHKLKSFGYDLIILIKNTIKRELVEVRVTALGSVLLFFLVPQIKQTSS